GRFRGELASGAGMGGGGAILNQAGAQLTLVRDTLDGNRAVRDVGAVEFTVVGGALLNLGTATVLGSQFSNNQAVGGGAADAIGGGLMNGGGSILNVVSCAVTGNLALGGDNGAISKDNPYAGGAYGGGIANNFNGNDGRGILNIAGSQIESNIAQGGSQ